MKVNIKGLVFVGFAAAILSGAAKADDTQIVTSKAFTEATYQKKIGGTAGQLPVTTATAGNVEYTTIETNKTGITTGATTIPTAGAVADKIADANSNANGRQTASTLDFQVGGASGAWKQIKPDSYISFADGTGDDAGKALVTINATTDTTLATENEGKLPTAGAVKTYVNNTANAKVSSSSTISDSSTTTAPNESAVYTALSGKQPNLTGTATQVTLGNATYKDIVSSSANVDNSTHADTIPTTGAVAGAISAAITGASLSQYEEKANILDDDTTGDNNNTIANNANSTTKYPSAKAVVTYVGNQINTALPAGTAGNVLTYSGTAGTVNSLAIDTTVSNSSNLVTSGAVNTAINGLLATYIPSGTTCSASNPCALVATGSNSFAWVPMAQSN